MSTLTVKQEDIESQRSRAPTAAKAKEDWLLAAVKNQLHEIKVALLDMEALNELGMAMRGDSTDNLTTAQQSLIASSEALKNGMDKHDTLTRELSVGTAMTNSQCVQKLIETFAELAVAHEKVCMAKDTVTTMEADSTARLKTYLDSAQYGGLTQRYYRLGCQAPWEACGVHKEDVDLLSKARQTWFVKKQATKNVEEIVACMAKIRGSIYLMEPDEAKEGLVMFHEVAQLYKETMATAACDGRSSVKEES